MTLADPAGPALGGTRPAESSEVPRTVCEIQELLADTRRRSPGIMWKLAEAGRQLDANLLSLSAGQFIDTHTESDLDVLVVVLAGTGTLTTVSGSLPLKAGSVVWLPRGSTRALHAGDDGLSYLTAHQRRPGMQIRTAASSESVTHKADKIGTQDRPGLDPSD